MIWFLLIVCIFGYFFIRAGMKYIARENAAYRERLRQSTDPGDKVMLKYWEAKDAEKAEQERYERMLKLSGYRKR